MKLLGKIMWLLVAIIFVIICIPLFPLLILDAICSEGLYDDSRDYYHRHL